MTDVVGVALAELADSPLDLAAHIDAVEHAGAGAVATFLGTVRDHSPDAPGEVRTLEYSAHPDAPRVLRDLVEGVAAEYPRARLALSHRVGTLGVGDIAIVVACASAHRAEAFDACRAAVEAVKAGLPVWKKQVLVDGSHTWVGSA